jgi:hypothetical protein
MALADYEVRRHSAARALARRDARSAIDTASTVRLAGA